MRKRILPVLLVVALALAVMPMAMAADISITVDSIEDMVDVEEACQPGNMVNITLESDITWPYIDQHLELPEGCTVVLDLNGHALIGTNSTGFLWNYGALTIKDSTATDGAHGIGNGRIYTTNVEAQARPAVINLGALTIDGGIFGDSDTVQTNQNDVQRGAALENYGTATINGGAFTACDNYSGPDNDGYAYAIINGSGNYSNAQMTINYATVYGHMNGVLSGSGGVMTVNDGVYTLSDGKSTNLFRMVYTSGSGRVEINGGTFTRNVSNDYGFFGDYSDTGEGITISGGTFENVDNDRNIIVDQGVVSISGGEFKSAIAASNATITVTGGEFSDTTGLEKFVQDGYELDNGQVVPSDTRIFASGTGSKADPYVVNSIEQFMAFRDSVNNGKIYAGQYVRLGVNLTLNDVNWTPIGNGTRSGKTFTGNSFNGTFDGDNHTISGLKYSGETTNEDNAIGLFGVVNGGVIQDLRLNDINVNVTNGKCVGAAIGLMVNGSTASNITVGADGEDNTIKASRGLGGVVGRMTVSGGIIDCVNYASVVGTSTASGNVGGIVGAAYYTENNSWMVISGCKNHGNVSNDCMGVGGIVGLSAAIVEDCENTSTVTGNGASIGGIVGEQQNAGKITGCVNTADITNLNSGAYGTGGIAGWVRYSGNDSEYPRKEIIEISDNVNTGSVDGGNDGGGIVGTVYNSAIVIGNENTAEKIEGTTFGAGIIGNIQYTEVPGTGIPAHDIDIYNNVSTTSIDNIMAQSKGEYIYNNSPDESDVIEDNAKIWAAKVGDQKYTTLDRAFSAAKPDSTVELVNNLEYAGQLNIPEGVTLDGGGYTLSATEEIENGGFIDVTSENATIRDITIDTNGKSKHGVQFYCTDSGRLENVNIIGGSYTSIIINGSQNVEIINCILTPDDGAYANVEYAMGDGINSEDEIPSMIVDGVVFKQAGADGRPVMVWADDDTVTNLKAALGGTPTNDQIKGQILSSIANRDTDDVTVTILFPAEGGGQPTIDQGVVEGVYIPPVVPSYSVSVAQTENGTITISTGSAVYGQTVTITVTPDTGYELGTLTVTDRNGQRVTVTANTNGTYSFVMPDGQVTVSATFTETVLPFSDVDSSDWFYEAVKYVYDNGLMDGVDGGLFDPNGTTTRAQIVTILYRLAGEPDISDENLGYPYEDVRSDFWYTDAIYWARLTGIAGGYDNGNFGPDDAITREQMAAMLYRYAEYKGYDVSGSTSLDQFPDGEDTSAWAEGTMGWAVAEGLISGGDGNVLLMPGGSAIRAQAATILMRFCENIAK